MQQVSFQFGGVGSQSLCSCTGQFALDCSGTLVRYSCSQLTCCKQYKQLINNGAVTSLKQQCQHDVLTTDVIVRLGCNCVKVGP